MMNGANLSLNSVDVQTPEGAFPIEQWAKLATDRIIQISDSTPEPLKQQAIAYRHHIFTTILHYMHQAIASSKTDIYRKLIAEGQDEVAKFIMEV